MSQNYVTDAGTLYIPGAYPSVKVEQTVTGIATTGVIVLVGEADAGPDLTLEADINANSFGPSELADVVAKYKSGNIVDAFRGAVSAANDPDIVGSFSRCILVKTNPSSKASLGLKKFDASAYGTLEDRTYGKIGNLISAVVVAKQAESGPSTGAFALLSPIASTNVEIRINGGAANALTFSAQESPANIALAIEAVPGVDVSGGADLLVINAGIVTTGSISLTVLSGNHVQVDLTVPFGAIPSVGDSLWIPAGSALASVHATNAGSYIVTGATASQILATKMLDVTGAHNALSAPITQGVLDVAATTDVMAFSAVTVHVVSSADPIAGVGKSMEIAELTTGTGFLSDMAYTLSAGVPSVVAWQSTVAGPKTISSAAEYIAKLTASRQLDSITEDLSAGGVVALSIGYKGTSASMVVDATTATITVVGGAGASPAVLSLADYATISDLSAYISSLTGFTAAPGTAVLGQQPSTSLDQGTYTIGSTFGAGNGRIKQDAYRFFNTVSNNAYLVQLHARAASGQPAPQALSYLSGGAKGATTDAIFNASIDRLSQARANFIVPLFSRDGSWDVADGLTEIGSTYTIDNIHAYCRSHVLSMSTQKRRRNRQAFLSKRDTFLNAEKAASTMASPRCSMTFQDVKAVKSNGGVFQFQPWMGAVKAAGMQAAGFYRAIFKKGIDISGVLQAAGDFDPEDDDKEESALQAGLLPIKQDETGLLFFVSDQTTYGKDNNFVYNSIQAVYGSDVIAITTAQQLDKAITGQSVADISAGFVLAALGSIMENLRRLKLIAASSDAPNGYKNEKVTLTGGVVKVSFEAKFAGAVYFVPISISLSQVQQSAG
jgi:hypothetical protein